MRESLGGARDRARVSLRQVNTSCWHSQCAAFGRSYVYAALEAGASGFAQRAPRRPALSRPCELVASGEALLAPTIARRLIDEYVRGRRTGSQPTEPGALTEREAEVLGLNAHGLSNTEIARHLIVSQATVKTHVNGSSPSSTSATASKPSCSPTNADSFDPASPGRPTPHRAEHGPRTRKPPRIVDSLLAPASVGGCRINHPRIRCVEL
jgi:hypothetical protein